MSEIQVRFEGFVNNVESSINKELALYVNRTMTAILLNEKHDIVQFIFKRIKLQPNYLLLMSQGRLQFKLDSDIYQILSTLDVAVEGNEVIISIDNYARDKFVANIIDETLNKINHELENHIAVKFQRAGNI